MSDIVVAHVREWYCVRCSNTNKNFRYICDKCSLAQVCTHWYMKEKCPMGNKCKFSHDVSIYTIDTDDEMTKTPHNSPVTATLGDVFSSALGQPMSVDYDYIMSDGGNGVTVGKTFTADRDPPQRRWPPDRDRLQSQTQSSNNPYLTNETTRRRSDISLGQQQQVVARPGKTYHFDYHNKYPGGGIILWYNDAFFVRYQRESLVSPNKFPLCKRQASFFLEQRKTGRIIDQYGDMAFFLGNANTGDVWGLFGGKNFWALNQHARNANELTSIHSLGVTFANLFLYNCNHKLTFHFERKMQRSHDDVSVLSKEHFHAMMRLFHRENNGKLDADLTNRAPVRLMFPNGKRLKPQHTPNPESRSLSPGSRPKSAWNSIMTSKELDPVEYKTAQPHTAHSDADDEEDCILQAPISSDDDEDMVDEKKMMNKSADFMRVTGSTPQMHEFMPNIDLGTNVPLPIGPPSYESRFPTLDGKVADHATVHCITKPFQLTAQLTGPVVAVRGMHLGKDSKEKVESESHVVMHAQPSLLFNHYACAGCHKNKATCFLTSCGAPKRHYMCTDCMKQGNKCPTCDVTYHKTQVRLMASETTKECYYYWICPVGHEQTHLAGTCMMCDNLNTTNPYVQECCGSFFGPSEIVCFFCNQAFEEGQMNLEKKTILTAHMTTKDQQLDSAQLFNAAPYESRLYEQCNANDHFALYGSHMVDVDPHAQARVLDELEDKVLSEVDDLVSDNISDAMSDSGVIESEDDDENVDEALAQIIVENNALEVEQRKLLERKEKRMQLQEAIEVRLALQASIKSLQEELEKNELGMNRVCA